MGLPRSLLRPRFRNVIFLLCTRVKKKSPLANLCRRGVKETGRGSAVAVVSHERDDAGGRSRQLEERVLEQVLGRGALGGLSHQHAV